jgi:hypothetical protein
MAKQGSGQFEDQIAPPSTMRYLQPARGEKVQAKVEALWLPARAQ